MAGVEGFELKPIDEKGFQKVNVAVNGDPCGIRTRDLLDENQIS